MVFPATPLDFAVDLYVGGEFVDITNPYVRAQAGITISRGRRGEDSKANAGQATLTIANKDGRFSPRNPTSPYYGLIGRNTPCRIAVRPHWTAGTLKDAADTFPRTVSNGWGTADSGGAWTTTLGTGGSVLAAQWSVGSGLGSIGVPAVTTVRRSELRDISTTDADMYVTVRAPLATGAALEAGATLRGSATLLTYVLAKVAFETSNAVTLSVATRAGVTTSVATGITHTGTGQPLRIRLRACGPYLMAKAWIASGSEPADWQVTVNDSADQTGPAPGAPGVYAAALTGNTNAKPVAVDFDNLQVYPEVPEIFGEVAAWPQKWESSGADAWTDIEVAGILRRLGQGAKAFRSPMRRLIESVAPSNEIGGLRDYWPAEDKSGSTSAASAIGNSPLVVFDASPSFGSDGPAGSAGAVKFADGTGLAGPINGYIGATAFTFAVCVNIPDPPPVGGASQIVNLTFTGATYRYWVFTVFESGGIDTIGLEIFDNTGTNRVVLDADPFTINGLNERYGRDLVIWISGRQNGTNVEYEWMVEDRGLGTMGSTGGSYAGTLGYGTFLRVPSNFDHIDWQYSHLAWWDAALDASWGTLDFPDLGYASAGYAGETAAVRFERLCGEEGVAYVAMSTAQRTGTPQMGVQGTGKLVDLLGECADADQGVITENRATLGLEFRTISTLYNQTAVALDYTAGHLYADVPDPSEEDQFIHNDVTVTRPSGSSFRAVQESGTLNVNDPTVDPDGVGLYDRGGAQVNVYSEDLLPPVAGWLRHIGTWPEPRWRGVVADMNQKAWLADPALAGQLMMLDTGDVATIANTPLWVPPGPAELMVQGYQHSIGESSWRVTFDTTPAGPYTVAQFDNATNAKLETSGTYVKAAQSSGATSFDVYTYDPDRSANNTPLWTETAAQFPIYWNVAGEKIKVGNTGVSGITHTNIAFRSVGTVAHANNASVTPGAPAGRAAGDLLLLMAAIRSTAATVTTPAGYSMLFNGLNFRIFGRIATNTAADLPTVSFAGGAAGDDTSARIAAFSGKFTNVDFLKVAETNSTNGSAQDINYAGLMPRWDNCLIITAGWKQDDWTSVATLSGQTEISEDSTITGNDQGFVWDYLVQTTRTKVKGASFVVTGGAAAVSKAAMLCIRSDTQTATVTRNQNNVTKAIAAAARVTSWTPARFGK